mmetsp:Transcript_392/g.720  ORF Transcript_392/g.720 Transcript_392/m.720 type:complete len:88 (-) Transcript_392:378-641(-)
MPKDNVLTSIQGTEGEEEAKSELFLGEGDSHLQTKKCCYFTRTIPSGKPLDLSKVKISVYTTKIYMICRIFLELYTFPTKINNEYLE